MAVTDVHEALGTFSIKLKPNVPRDVLDRIEYFGHIAVVPGRIEAQAYGDGTLDAARYVGVVRKKKVSDQTSSTAFSMSLNQEVAGTNVTLEGAGMNFWLGDEDDKGSVLETEIALAGVNFTQAVSALLPPAVGMGTVGGVSGTYTGNHQWETPRKALQYVCKTMAQPPGAVNLISANNSSFEGTGGTSGWLASNCSIAVSANYSYVGSKSMSVSPSGVGNMTIKASGANALPVTPGTTYICYYWILPTGPSCSARIDLDYRTTGGGLVSSESATSYTILPANAWTQIARTFTVPTSGSITTVDPTINLNSNATADKFAIDNVWLHSSIPESPTSFRVNNRGDIDAGPESDLFVTNPRCVLVRQGSLQGEDMQVKAIPGTIGFDQDMEDFATRVVILAGSDGLQFSVGESDIGSIAPGTNVYKDIKGNPLRLTRLVSESQTTEANADIRAELALRQYINPHREINLNTEDFDVFGSFEVGDYVYVYDPDGNMVDTGNEITIRGLRVNPMKLRVTECDWPVTNDYSVAYRGPDGTWYDLTDYVEFEEHRSARVVVGNIQRTLDEDLQSVPARLGVILSPDNLTPGQTQWVVGSFKTTTSLDSVGMARAQQRLVWLTPTNTDGSVIGDGAYYELQYRLNTGHLYSQTWGAVNNLNWNELNTWNQPVASDVVEYETRFITWGTNSVVLNGLAAGTAYDVRIRAVDTSNNIGQWSPVEIVTTAEDNIPPSQPNAPTVAASMVSVQVIHNLGMASGGEYNLEKDLAYLEIHGEYEPGYVPSEETKLGQLLATAAQIDAQTPAVGTFPVTNTEAIYIKVVAVDASGNRSSPSVAAEVTAELIDDAHISDLTVSKVTAGVMTADWVVAGSIRTGSEGQRVEINSAGLQAYNNEGDLTTNISADPTIDRDFISWRGTDGNVLASINSLGQGSFQDVSVSNSLTVQGLDLYEDLLKRPKGVVAWGQFPIDPAYDVAMISSGVEHGYMELSFVAEVDRMYKISVYGECESSFAGNQQMSWVIRDGGDARPTTLSPALNSQLFLGGWNAGINTTHIFSFIWSFPAGTHRLLWSISGNGVDQTIFSTAGPSQFWVEDMGDISLFDNIAVLNDGLGTAPEDESGDVTTYTKTYNASWTRSYAGDNDLRNEYYISRLYQGRYDGNYGQQKSLVGFDDSAIRADLSGAVIKSIEVYLYANHWYSDYGTALIGTHNYGSPPGTWGDGSVNQNRTSVSSWNKATGKWVVLDNSWGDEFKNGTTKGIALGPTTSTDHIYYGHFQGVDAGSNPPKLRITYTK